MGRFETPLTERTIHLCVDMQRLFTADGPWPGHWIDRTLPVIAQIAEQHPDRTIFTRFIPPEEPGDLPGRWQRYYERWRKVTREFLDPRLLDLVEPLAKLAPPAIVIDKPVYSPFTGWRLSTILRERQADGLIITGAETDVCVLATVLGAVDLGHRVILVSDAVCSSSDAGHDALLTVYRERFSEQIEVAMAEEVLSNWP